MTIKCVKLQTGEELIAETSMLGSSVNIIQPFILQMMKDPNDPSGEVQLALFPYVPYVKEHTIMVDASKIIWVAELPDSMIADYKNAKKKLETTRQLSPHSSPVNITTTI